MDLPITNGLASSNVLVTAPTQGTSPTPTLPLLSFKITILRVKNGE